MKPIVIMTKTRTKKAISLNLDHIKLSGLIAENPIPSAAYDLGINPIF